jgi:hypothetical protein
VRVGRLRRGSGPEEVERVETQPDEVDQRLPGDERPVEGLVDGVDGGDLIASLREY